MNEQKLIFILTWLFLICIVLASSEISIFIFNYGPSPDYIGFMFIANLIAAGFVSVNLFAHYLKRTDLYRWVKYGFGFSVIGCLFVIFYNIYLEKTCYNAGCRNSFINIPLHSLPIFILSLAGFKLTSNLENNKKSSDMDYHKLTLIFNVLVSFMMAITIYILISSGIIFAKAYLIIFSIYGIAAIVILFNIIVFATKKWNFYLPVIIGYGIFTFGNLCFVITIIWEYVTFVHHPNKISLSIFFWAFAWMFLYAICGMFGLILTIFSYNEAKKHGGRIGIIEATAAILPTKANPKAAW